jgi:hypothetical protein
MPISAAARMTRMAISLRLATSKLVIFCVFMMAEPGKVEKVLRCIIVP